MSIRDHLFARFWLPLPALEDYDRLSTLDSLIRRIVVFLGLRWFRINRQFLRILYLRKKIATRQKILRCVQSLSQPCLDLEYRICLLWSRSIDAVKSLVGHWRMQIESIDYGPAFERLSDGSIRQDERTFARIACIDSLSAKHPWMDFSDYQIA